VNLIEGADFDSLLRKKLDEALERNRMLQEELEATNRGLLALTIEAEERSEEVQAITQQLWQFARMATMGELAASIAHELNNPLTTVSLWIELLSGQIAPDDPMQRPLRIIYQETNRMAALINNLLDFSRYQERRVCSLDISVEIEYALELIVFHFRKRGINIIKDFQPSLPLIQAERQELQQLFLNLLTNASDAMPDGGDLTIKIYVEYGDNNSVVLEISDTGIGIEPANLSKVMAPFFTTKPHGKGTGLGLPICRRIVREHNGSINISSQYKKGTTVTIKFPIIGDSL